MVRKLREENLIHSAVQFAVDRGGWHVVREQPSVFEIVGALRLERFDPATDRLTLTEVRRRILEQTGLFRPEDLIPVPCHPDSLAMAYALKIDGKLIPLTGLVDPKVLIEGGRNTIVYEGDDAVRDHYRDAVLRASEVLQEARAYRAREEAAHAFGDAQSFLDEFFPGRGVTS